MSQFITLWNGLGWIANLITVVLGLFTVGGGLYSIFKCAKKLADNANDYSNLLSYIKTRECSQNQEAKKHRKIAIIDDQPEHYPVDYLRKRGFDLAVYEEVSLTNYEFINNYDLIFMDVTNVVKEDPQRGGFELIKRIRSEFDGIVIIGVSSKRFDPTLTEFFKMCDEQSRTPIAEQECESLIIELINKNFSPLNIAKEVDQMLGESFLSHSQNKKIINYITCFVNNSLDDEELIKKVSRASHKVDSHKLLEKCSILKGLL
jgi:CheY-like chemotaxis protein